MAIETDVIIINCGLLMRAAFNTVEALQQQDTAKLVKNLEYIKQLTDGMLTDRDWSIATVNFGYGYEIHKVPLKK